MADNIRPPISVVVPCYNEEENIELIFNEFEKLRVHIPEIEVLFVNNGSADQSSTAILENIEKANYAGFRLLELKHNLGYGNGILEGLKIAQSDLLAWTHADMQTDPLDILRAYELMSSDKNSILVKGSRKNRKWTEAVFSYGMALLSSLVLGVRLKEINAQPKVFRRAFYLDIRDAAPLDFSLDLYLLYHAVNRGAVKEIPVYFKVREHGEAKGGGSFKTKIKLIKRTFKYIFELRKNIINAKYPQNGVSKSV